MVEENDMNALLDDLFDELASSSDEITLSVSRSALDELTTPTGRKLRIIADAVGPPHDVQLRKGVIVKTPEVMFANSWKVGDNKSSDTAQKKKPVARIIPQKVPIPYVPGTPVIRVPPESPPIVPAPLPIPLSGHIPVTEPIPDDSLPEIDIEDIELDKPDAAETVLNAYDAERTKNEESLHAMTTDFFKKHSIPSLNGYSKYLEHEKGTTDSIHARRDKQNLSDYLESIDVKDKLPSLEATFSSLIDPTYREEKDIFTIEKERVEKEVRGVSSALMSQLLQKQRDNMWTDLDAQTYTHIGTVCNNMKLVDAGNMPTYELEEAAHFMGVSDLFRSYQAIIPKKQEVTEWNAQRRTTQITDMTRRDKDLINAIFQKAAHSAIEKRLPKPKKDKYYDLMGNALRKIKDEGVVPYSSSLDEAIDVLEIGDEFSKFRELYVTSPDVDLGESAESDTLLNALKDRYSSALGDLKYALQLAESKIHVDPGTADAVTAVTRAMYLAESGREVSDDWIRPHLDSISLAGEFDKYIHRKTEYVNEKTHFMNATMLENLLCGDIHEGDELRSVVDEIISIRGYEADIMRYTANRVAVLESIRTRGGLECITEIIEEEAEQSFMITREEHVHQLAESIGQEVQAHGEHQGYIRKFTEYLASRCEQRMMDEVMNWGADESNLDAKMSSNIHAAIKESRDDLKEDVPDICDQMTEGVMLAMAVFVKKYIDDMRPHVYKRRRIQSRYMA